MFGVFRTYSIVTSTVKSDLSATLGEDNGPNLHGLESTDSTRRPNFVQGEGTMEFGRI